MKTLKQFKTQIDLSEQQLGHPSVTPGNPDGAVDDGSILPCNLEDPSVLAKINGFVGAIGKRCYINPEIPIRQLQSKLMRVGLWFEYHNEFGLVMTKPTVMQFPIIRHGGKTGFIHDADGFVSSTSGFSNGATFNLVLKCVKNQETGDYCITGRIEPGSIPGQSGLLD